MVDYAKKRIKDHIGRFTKLYYQLKDDNIDVQFLKTISKQDCIFQKLIICFIFNYFVAFNILYLSISFTLVWLIE